MTLRAANWHNEHLLLGFSELNRLKSERPLVFEKGHGIFVVDENGKDYIEAVSTFYCVALGFSEERLIEAAVRQMRALPMYPSAIHRTVPAVIELSERLAAIAPVRNARVYLSVTGSEANDHLIKLMWYGNRFAGEPERRKIVSRRASYHGSTVLTASLGGSADLHESFAIPMGLSVLVSHPAWPAAAEPGESEEAFTDRLAAELEAAIQAAGPKTVAAMIAEPCSVSAGIVPPPRGYFAKLAAVLRRHGIRFLVDEVVTGFGRTGHMWASEALGLEPDAVTSAKGLTSAYMPLAAILLGEDLAERIERGSREKGWLAHGGTHHGHAVSAAVALEVLAIFEERDVLGHVRRTIPVWNRMLDRLQDHPLVVGTRRFGLMGAVEVAPPGAGRSGPAATLEVGGIAKAIYEAGLEQGIITRPLAGCLCLAPPLITTEAEIDEIGRRLGAALDQVLATLPRARAAE